MEHVRFFTGFPALSELQTFLSSKEDVPFQTSELYSRVVDDKIVDEKLRKSCFRVFQDREIFDLVHQTIEWLNESDQQFSYQLHRDNITETRYQNGGHFSKHKDFLLVTSNLVEEFTLILCVSPPGFGPAEGGETLIYPYASKDGVPFDTAKPGNGLLFRKDLEHAGNLLKAGEKHILTANIWATRKHASNRVLFVTFPNAQELAFESAEARLKQVANQNTSYAFPVDCLKGTMLDAHVRFFNQKHEQQGQDLPTIVPYVCNDFSFDKFGIVAKILLRSYVHENEVRQHADCIEFFGPFRAETLLVNLALEPKAPTDPDASCQRFVQPANATNSRGDKKLPAKKFKATGDSAPEESDGMDVIVCENESRAMVVYEVARRLGVDSYVPFKMIFVEGQIATGYYNNVQNIGVTPVALLVGEYNHIFAIQKCGTYGVVEHTLQEHFTKRNYFADGGTYDIFDTDDEWDDYLVQRQWDFMGGGCFCLGLKVAIGEDSARDKLTRYIFEGPESISVHPSDFLLLPEILAERSSESEEETAEGDSGVKETSATSLFHRDDSGKVIFSPQEADSASKYIASMDLDERVKACLQKKCFELPQESQTIDEYYCNESTYASLNVLSVAGVMRLDASVAVSLTSDASTKPKFDVWPTKESWKKISRERNEHFRRVGIPNPFVSDY